MHRCITIFPATIQDRDTMPGYRYMTILKHTFLSIVVTFVYLQIRKCFFLPHAFFCVFTHSAREWRVLEHNRRPTGCALQNSAGMKKSNVKTNLRQTATTDARQHKLYAIYIVQQSLYPFYTVSIPRALYWSFPVINCRTPLRDNFLANQFVALCQVLLAMM